MRHHRGHRRWRGTRSSCSRVSSVSSTGATTPPAWLCSPRGSRGGPGPPPGRARSRTCARSSRRAPGRHRRHRPHPLGHPRAPHRGNAHPISTAPGRGRRAQRHHRELAGAGRAAARRGAYLRSDTDTEVFAHLVERELGPVSVLADAVRATLREVRGAFALAVVCRRASRAPSSPPGACHRCHRHGRRRAGEACSPRISPPCSAGHARVLGARRRPDRGAPPRVDAGHDIAGQRGRAQRAARRLGPRAAEKGGYPDFMGKEIHEQPRAIADTLSAACSPTPRSSSTNCAITDDELAQLDKVFVVACGIELPRRHGGQVRHRASGPAAHRDRHRLGVPLPRPRARRADPWSSA